MNTAVDMEQTDQSTRSWQQANQRYLTAALSVVREALERRSAPPPEGALSSVRERLAAAAEQLPAPSALETLCLALGLSNFERDVLLMCAGVELDSSFAETCARAQGNSGSGRPTFSLALTALPEPHWSALIPGAPLRYWRLIEISGDDRSLSTSPLRIDERTLHYLAGLRYLDEALQGFVRAETPGPEELVPSHRRLVGSAAALWSDAARPLPVLQLAGPDTAAKRGIAAAAAARLGLNLYVMRAQVLPTAPQDLDILIRLWEREALLAGNVLLLECDEVPRDDATRAGLVAGFLEAVACPVFVASAESQLLRHRPSVTIEVNKATAAEQRELWRAVLGEEEAAQDGTVERLVAHFNLGSGSIRAAAEHARSTTGDGARGESLGERLWTACATQARPRLGNLAQRIEPAATWRDIVLSEAQEGTLRTIVQHVRQRTEVYENWGFAAKSSRGLGISALFSGPSGTGKTMAAEVLANELRLDLYHIDLSRVVSKYIGETEKNLARVFDAAEEGGALLLFDEADALFGKRSEVKDSHDRYANIEVSYLLQRMESYRGLAILTTNMKESIDDAFLRRIRFVVPFPFPDAERRARIWRSVFPAGAPTNGLDYEALSRLNIAGGNIRNVAMNAAVLAAEAGEPVCMAHVLRATRDEYAKLEKPFTNAEIRGWP